MGEGRHDLADRMAVEDGWGNGVIGRGKGAAFRQKPRGQARDGPDRGCGCRRCCCPHGLRQLDAQIAKIKGW